MKTLVAVLILSAISLGAAEPPNPLHDIPIAAPAVRPIDIGPSHIASDGESFFAVWSDHRAHNSDIYGARFSAAGELLDPDGRVIHATYENETTPVTLWNGADYLTFSSSGFLGVWNTFVSAGGEPRGAGGERLPQSSVAPDAAFNGSRYAQPQATSLMNGYRLELLLRDEGLNVVQRVMLAEDPGAASSIHSARVASDGRRFFVVWQRQVEFERIVDAAIVDENGNVTTPPFELARATATQLEWATFSPDVEWNGTSFLVVMSARDGVRAVPVAPDGTRGAEKLIAAGSVVNPAIAWDGHAHIVLWNVRWMFSQIATRGAVVTATGDVVETFEVSDRDLFYGPSIASNGDVFLAIVDSEALVLRSTGPERIVRRGPVTNAYREQTAPAIAAGATNLLTAWVETRQELWIGRLSRRGEALDGGGIRLAGGYFVAGLRVHAARGFYVVIWQGSGGESRIARVTEAGEVIDPGGIVVAASGTVPIAATNDGVTRLVWGQRNPQTMSPPLDIMTATITERGPLSPPTLVAAAGTTFTPLELFPNGDRFTLLYSVLIPPACPQPRFCPVEFEYRSLVIDEEGRPAASVLVAPRGLFFDAAADERSILITWYEGFSHHTRRLGFDGVPVGDAIALPQSQTPRAFPRLARTAYGFVLLRNDAAVEAVHLDRDGRPVTAASPLLQTANPNVSDATYVDGQTWLTYTSSWAPLPNAHNGAITRAWVHVMGPRRRAAR